MFDSNIRGGRVGSRRDQGASYVQISVEYGGDTNEIEDGIDQEDAVFVLDWTDWRKYDEGEEENVSWNN